MMVSVNEFLEQYAISRATLYRLVAKGQLRLTKIGRATRIKQSDAAEWLASLPTSNGGQA